MKNRAFSLAVIAFLSSAAAFAQPLLRVPQSSPKAEVRETFGITDVSVAYHRPAVNNRRIWGGLVPHDVVWRAGANENTTIAFSTPVTIEGQPLPAGKYSIFFIPSEQQWTAVFNRFTGGWGTYSYDAAQDVLRVKVTPQPGEMQERMLFTFDDGTADAVTLTMRWEKMRVPVRIGAETTKLTLASIDDQMRSALHWVPQAWREAAGYALRSNETDRALAYIDHSIAISADAFNLRTKARILDKKGDAAGAKALRDRAAVLSPAVLEMNRAYEALGAKKPDEALAILNQYVAANGDSWRAWSAFGTVYAAKNEIEKSKQAFAKAMSLAPTQSERTEVQDSINDLAAEKK